MWAGNLGLGIATSVVGSVFDSNEDVNLSVRFLEERVSSYIRRKLSSPLSYDLETSQNDSIR